MVSRTVTVSSRSLVASQPVHLVCQTLWVRAPGTSSITSPGSLLGRQTLRAPYLLIQNPHFNKHPPGIFPWKFQKL